MADAMKSGITLNALLQRLILLCVLPLVLLAIILAWSRMMDLREQSHQGAARVARNFARALDDNLASRISGLEILAASAFADDPPQLASLYQQALAFRNHFGGEVIFADRSMQMLFHTRTTLGAILPKLPLPAGNAAAPNALSSGKPAIGDRFVGPIAREPLVAIALPVTRSGNAHALLLNLIETARLQRRLDELDLPAEWAMTILDSSNNILARRGTLQAAAQADTVDAPERIAIKSTQSRWSVVLEIPRAIYLAPMIDAGITILALILATTLISILAGRRAGRQLSRAVATLTATTSLPASQGQPIAERERIRQTLAESRAFRASSEAALRESEARYRKLFESNPQPMWTFDLDTLAFLSVNDAAIAQYGYSREEFLSMTISDIRQREDLRLLDEDLTRSRPGLGESRLWCQRRKDGSEFTVEIAAHSLQFGDRSARLVLAHDVTARVRAEAKLRLSEENLSITLQSIGDAVIATDTLGMITRMNGTAERLTGWKQSSAIGRPMRDVFQIVNALTREPLTDPVQLVMEQGEVVEVSNNVTLLSQDGHEYQVSDSAAPIRNPDGNIVGVVLVFSDVTETYKVRQALAQTVAVLERVSEIAKVGGWELDLRTMTLFWSMETCRIHEADSLVAPSLEKGMELFVPDARPVIRAAMDAAIKDGTPYDLELQKFTLKGRTIWIRTQCIAVKEGGKVVKLLGALHDVTLRKKAEEAVRKSKAFTNAILDSMAAQIAVLDKSGTIIAVNEPWRRFAAENSPVNGGAARRTGVGVNYLAVCGASSGAPADELSIHARDGIQAVLDGRLPHFAMEYPCHSPKQQRWFVLNATALDSGDGGVVVAHNNITERKEAEAARMAIVNSSMDAIITVDEDERILVFNAAAERLFNLSAEAAIGQSMDRFIPSRFRAGHHGHIRAFMAGGTEARKMGQFSRLSALRQDGEEFPIEASVSHVLVDGKHFLTVTLRDVSEREAAEALRDSLEEQLREMQKMQAIGTLAGGIAHDFNNILATILGNVDLAHEELGNNARVGESLLEIRKAGGRARDLVQQILSFSRRQATEFAPTALGSVVEESVRLMRASLPARVKIEVQCAAGVPLVLADATQIEQVLINLGTNAAQAMRNSPGHIRIKLDTVTHDAVLADEPQALLDMRKLHATPSGRIVRLTVNDDGPGMDVATRKRIFEPFFTTKPVGEGTGLGLSVVHGIVQAHRGAIVVESETGKGATFTLYLPLAQVQATLPPPDAIAAAPTNCATGGQHILYIDDDEALVFLVKRLLERRGCRIRGYTNQQEALNALRADPAAFDLVVTDYNMPGMSGLDVAREVRTIRADLPVAIASGFIDETLRAQANAAGVRELIFKASAVEDLCDAFVRMALTVASETRSP